jgi:hypothetical protein
MVIPRTVKAQLVERYIFNFRIPPSELAWHLPVKYLEPLSINGWSVASFCILSLDQVIVAPLPGWLGKKTISCAFRCGITERSDSGTGPSVWIVDRNTDLALVARLAPFLFLDTIPMVRLQIDHNATNVAIRVHFLDRQQMFAADVHGVGEPLDFRSIVFDDSIDNFASFMRSGVSSYTPSVFGDALAMVDLHKEEPTYEPLDADIRFDWLENIWQNSKLEFDSAVRARGGEYRWTYRGLRTEV